MAPSALEAATIGWSIVNPGGNTSAMLEVSNEFSINSPTTVTDIGGGQSAILKLGQIFANNMNKNISYNYAIYKNKIQNLKMTRLPILNPEETYTFSRYAELTFDPEDILAELGFSLEKAALAMPQFSGHLDCTALKERLEQDLLCVDLTSETARREVLIAPTLLELCRLSQSKLKIEYPVMVNNFLKGTLDYFVISRTNLLVVEAKNADMARGMTQLAVELIAIDSWTNLEVSILYGAVTTGDIWKFAFLQREQNCINVDINLYRVPADLDNLLRMLIGIIQS